MSNLYKQFLDLMPSEPLQVGEVTAHNADGTSSVTILDGSTLRARGTDVSVGNRAFVKGGVIQGRAPSLPYYEFELV